MNGPHGAQRFDGDPDPAAGLQLRVAAATEAGVAPEAAESMLVEMRPLETAEYLKKSSGLTLSERRRLVALRAGLRGLDPARVEGDLSDSAQESGARLAEYWNWVVGRANPNDATRQRNRIPGNLAAAIAREPDRQAFVLESWDLFAGVIGIVDGERRPVLGELGGHLDRCRMSDTEAPTARALDIGFDIAALTGLPHPLITAHREAWAEERSIVLATNEVLDERARHGSLVAYHGQSAQVAYLGFPPRTKLGGDGRVHLVLAAPEAAQLNGDIASKVIIRLIQTLRRGDLPERRLAFRAAYGVFLDRRHGKRGVDGEPRADCPGGAQKGSPPPRPGLEPASEEEPEPPPSSQARLTAAVQFIVAQEWLGVAIEDTLQRLTAGLVQHGPDGVFPTAAYGNSRAASLGSIHLRAAQNCLQYVTSVAYLHKDRLTPTLPAQEDPKSEFTRHMRATAPAIWSGSGKARQLTVGFVGAVAWAAWLAVKSVDPTDAPEVAAESAAELVVALQNFAGIAALDGIAGMVKRFASPQRRPYDAWLATVRHGADFIAQIADSLTRSVGIAGHAGLPPVIATLRDLSQQYRGAAEAIIMDESAGSEYEADRRNQLRAAADRLSEAAEQLHAAWRLS